MPDDPPWRWEIAEGQEMRAERTTSGVRYVGWDWVSLSGGAYSAGFQSFDAFVSDGPLYGMPEPFADAIRQQIASLPPGVRMRIEVAGEAPTEAHLSLDGAPILLRPQHGVLFEGVLPEGEHTVTGMLLYAGADRAGRRRSATIAQTFRVVRGAGSVLTMHPAPRWEG